MRTRSRGRAGVRLVVGLVLVALGWWSVLEADAGFEERELAVGTVPVTVLVPDGARDAPGVVVAHGFSGSRTLMRSWSLALVRAGYVVAAPDLAGHGANPEPLAREEDEDLLPREVLATLGALAAQPEVDATRLALLGHSMGSGAAMSAGIGDPERVGAVVAVSPTDAAVTAELPRDLLLLAGANEPRFVANARDLLERAGGSKGRAGDGDARALGIVPRVEHVTILFAPSAHDASIAWLDASLGHESPPRGDVWIVLAWLAALVGGLLLWQAIAAWLVTPVEALRERRHPLPGLVIAAVAATATLVVLGRVVTLSSVGGMLVGPALALWFALVGAVWWWSGARPQPGDGRDLGWTLLTVLAAVLAFGVLGARVWLPWWLPRTRALFVVPLALALLPFTLAWAAALHPRRGRRALGWWAVGSLVVAAGALVTGLTVPGMQVLVLFVPLLPGVLAVVSALAAPLERPWSAGIASATFLAWTMAALFPLV